MKNLTREKYLNLTDALYEKKIILHFKIKLELIKS